MRLTLFLLVLANLLFFAWARGDLGSNDRQPMREDELRADRIRLVSNRRPPGTVLAAPLQDPPVSPPSATAEPSCQACASLTDLSPAEADAIERLFAEKLPAFTLSRTNLSNYWVHIPPFKTRREAESKVTELKNLGVKDYFIQQDGHENFAVSLGLFSTQAAAESALADLRGKGVRSARIIERARRPPVSRIEISGPEEEVREMRQLITEALP